MAKYGIIGAMEVEISELLSAMTEEKKLTRASMEFHEGRIGGADIKFAAACAFSLGMAKSICGLIVGLTLAIAVNAVIGAIRRKNNKEYGFPMLPYLAAGFFAAYFI